MPHDDGVYELSIRTRVVDFVTKALDPKRAPIGTQISFGSGTGLGGDYAQAYASNGYVYAAASKIAQAVGEAEPHLYRRKGDDVEEVFDHPLLDLLAYCTPYHTRQEAFELEQTYLDLTGEWAMLIFRDGFGIRELWPINPRQLSVVPHPTEYISGYVFNSNDGRTKVPLEPKDVLFIRMPNPNSLYRGQGVIQSIATDIDADRYAALWNKNFFINGASHGGAIEVPKELTPDAYERLILQWRQGHQGIANAHKIAILQGGAKWIPPQSALKDMDFPNLRQANRDIILGAFGMSPHMLGAEADVNRASSESAEYVFSRWVINPRLRRISGKINEFLLPQYPNSDDLWLEFEDPTPENREFDLQLAKDGFAAGFLTRNEARELVGMNNLGEPGDIFFMGIMAVPQAMSETPLPASPDDAGDTQDDEAKGSVTGAPNMHKTLTPEVRWNAFAKRLTPMENKFSRWVKGEFAGQRRETLGRLQASKGITTKLIGDIYSAGEYAKAMEDGSLRYLKAMIVMAGEDAAAEIGSMFAVDNPRVMEYLGNKTRLFGKNVTTTIADQITEQLRLAQAAGESIPQTMTRIQHVFDVADARAETIARTEMVGSANRGSLEAYKQGGISENEWIATRDDRTRDSHWAMDGTIVAVGSDFWVGGGHGPCPGEIGDPAEDCNCRCTIAPVIRRGGR